MRVHLTLDDEVVHELDRRVGPRRRSAFIVSSVRAALDDARRWEDVEAGLGGIADTGHPWDDDPAAWVHSERFSDLHRIG